MIAQKQGGTFIDLGNIIGAAFIPDDPDRILLVNELDILAIR